MNYLTNIKNTQRATKREIDLGISGDKGSWHDRFAHSAYIFVGGLPFELTEGDVLAVFSQYGEIVHVHLVRDPSTGKSRGFAFLAYEDQRSTVLAVDNFSGAKVAGRIVRVEHVDNYRMKREEVEGPNLKYDRASDARQKATGADINEGRGISRSREDDYSGQRVNREYDNDTWGSGGAGKEATPSNGEGGTTLSVAGVMDEARRKGMGNAWHDLLRSGAPKDVDSQVNALEKSKKKSSGGKRKEKHHSREKKHRSERMRTDGKYGDLGGNREHRKRDR